MRLSEVEKEKVRYHLSYVEGGPSSSRTVLEYRMENLRSHQHRVMVQQDIARCDYGLAKLGLDDQGTAVASTTITVGDLDRSTTNYASEPLKRRQRAYDEACKLLAMHLGVEMVSLAEPQQWRYTLEQVGIPPAPGPSDTIIESKIRASRRYI